jgi:hypothetical protein
MRRQIQPSPCPLSTKASIQVNANRAGWRGQQQKQDLRTQGRFSRRLQLDPGLTPPTSWSLSPCTGPRIHWRAKLVDCPGLGAIYLNLARSPVNLCVMAVIATSSVLRAFMSRRYESLTRVSAGSDHKQGSSARHPRPRHPARRATLHGRAWQRPDPGGGGLPRIHGLPAGGRDPLILSAVEETSRSQL